MVDDKIREESFQETRPQPVIDSETNANVIRALQKLWAFFLFELVMWVVNVIVLGWAKKTDKVALFSFGIGFVMIPLTCTTLVTLCETLLAATKPTLTQLELEKKAMSLPNQIRFLKMIVQTNPGIPTHEWDPVASKMNDYLYSSGSYSDPRYFKDGKACFEKFKSLFLDSYSTVLTKNNSGSSRILQPYVTEAVTLYEANLKAYWPQGITASPDIE